MRSILVTVLCAVPLVASADVADDLRDADRRYEDAEFKKAAAAFDRAIRSDPGQVPAEAYAKRASIYIIAKEYEGALAFIRSTAKKQHPNAAEILEQEAAALWELGKKADAVNVAEEAAKRKASAWVAQRLVGDYYAARDPEKTAAAYQAYLEHRPKEQEANDVLPRVRLGYAYIAIGNRRLAEDDQAKAQSAFQSAVEQFTTLQRKHGKAKHSGINAQLGLCASYTALGKDDQAITICEQITRDKPRAEADQSGSVYYNLGKAYLKKKQYVRARAAATEFKRKRPSEPRAFILMGDSYFQEGNWEQALQNYLEAEKLLKNATPATEVHLAMQMGIAYRNLRKPAEAIAKLEKARDRNANDPRLASELGAAYLSDRKDEKAVAVTDAIINGKAFDKLAAPRKKDLLLIAGRGLFNQGKDREARARFAAAHELDATDTKVRTALVQTIQFQAFRAFDKKEYADAQKLLDEAAAIDSKNADTHRNRAVIAIDQGQCDRALEHLARLKDAQGQALYYERLSARANLCIKKPNRKRAIEHYAAAEREAKRVGDNLTLAAVYIESALTDANLDAQVEKLQDAVQFTNSEKKLNAAAKRNLAIALYRRGWRNLKEGKSTQAASDFERAGREPALLKGNEPLAFEFSYALALLDKGDTGEAARLFKALDTKGNQSKYLKAPYDKVGTRFFAAYASYRGGTAEKREQAAREFASLQGSAGGAFGAKLKELLASSWEYVAYDHWKSGNRSAASKALASAEKYASAAATARIRNNKAVLSLDKKDIKIFEDLGGNPPEALVNLGILYDLSGKPKEAYEAWKRAAARNVNARELDKWIDAKKRIYGFN